MKNQCKYFAMLLTFVLGIGYAFSQSAGIKVAYRKGNNIFTIDADGQPKRLTDDSLSKGWPVWSKDGRKIAFLREINETVALDNLIIVDAETGKTLADIRICPVTPDDEIYDVRYIQGIEWLTEDKIAAVGNVNPSTGQTFVYELKTGKELMDYPDDDGGAVFSPNGEHAATEDGMQHWLSDADREPELDIDNQRIYPAKSLHVSLLSVPAWSENSQKVAFVAEDYLSNQIRVVVCKHKGDCLSTELPADIQTSGDNSQDARFRVQWKEGRVFVTYPEVVLPQDQGTVQESTWSLHPGDATAVVSATPPDLMPNVYDTPLTFENKIQKLGGEKALKLLKQVQKLGGIEPDLWCKDCALAKLPRQAPMQ
jgi:hypothetical protein